MKILNDLLSQANQAEKAFDEACSVHYCDGRWGYYRAVECDQTVPEILHEKCDAFLAALHSYYQKRDGTRGFLGSRGL